MYTVEQIKSRATIDPQINEKYAYFCTECPWWSSNVEDAADDPQAPTDRKVPRCPQCDHKLRIQVLAFFLAEHRRLEPQDWLVFLSTHHDNEYWRKNESDS
jgi:NAD-dependent SIR2 family protein deacetylase